MPLGLFKPYKPNKRYEPNKPDNSARDKLVFAFLILSPDFCFLYSVFTLFPDVQAALDSTTLRL